VASPVLASSASPSPSRKKGSALASDLVYADVDELGDHLRGFERLLIGPGGLLVNSCDPIAVLEREGDDVVLTDRGKHGARFYQRYWLPKETDWKP
jgi:hypothetical protein